MTAALFVETNGIYFDVEGVDPWDLVRDARKYPGPFPVVAHPPCARWGSYWYGGPSSKVRKIRGDDDGCFEAALSSIREWGGVIEHPANSSAWRKFQLPMPPASGGWVEGLFGGWSCQVDQGHYGHRARKPTWLYYVSKNPPPALRWGPSDKKLKVDLGFQKPGQRAMAKAEGKPLEYLSHRERAATPREFRDLLIGLAEMAAQP